MFSLFEWACFAALAGVLVVAGALVFLLWGK